MRETIPSEVGPTRCHALTAFNESADDAPHCGLLVSACHALHLQRLSSQPEAESANYRRLVLESWVGRRRGGVARDKLQGGKGA